MAGASLPSCLNAWVRCRESARQARPASSPQLGVDMGQVELLDADEQLRRHLTIFHSCRHQARHRQFLGSQSRRIELPTLRRRQPACRQLLFAPLRIRPRPLSHEPIPRRRQPLRCRSSLPRPPQHQPVGQPGQPTLERQRGLPLVAWTHWTVLSYPSGSGTALHRNAGQPSARTPSCGCRLVCGTRAVRSGPLRSAPGPVVTAESRPRDPCRG